MSEKRILFVGDSITDCGRERPIAGRNNLGDGYVSLINAMLEMDMPHEQCRVLNCGISGNTVVDLAERWQSDVLDWSPHCITMMIGINDVWRHFDNPAMADTHVAVNTYGGTLGGLIASAKSAGEATNSTVAQSEGNATSRPKTPRIILMTPFFLELNQQDALRKKLNTYIDTMKQVAKETNCELIDLQQIFDTYLTKGAPHGIYSMFLAADRVHPNLTGHTLIARAWVEQFRRNL